MKDNPMLQNQQWVGENKSFNMKKLILSGLFFLVLTPIMGQTTFLKDTLFRDSIVLPNEKKITIFKDYESNIDNLNLKSPTAEDGSPVEYLVKGISTQKEMEFIIHEKSVGCKRAIAI